MPSIRIKKRPVLKAGLRLSLIILLFLSPMSATAQTNQGNPQFPGDNYLRENYSYRIETSITFEHLSPNAAYGDWLNGDAALYAKVHQNVTAFGRFSHHSRDIEGDGQIAVAGAYVEWQPWLTTYSAVSCGFGKSYLPDSRIDHDFNFAITPFVFTLGASFINYEGPQEDRIVSLGATWYHGRWISEYRLFRNTSDPGDLDSDTHLFSVGYGEEGWRWIYLKLSLGAQAYQATTLAVPQDVRQDATEISLYHRHWMGKDWGLMERAAFLSLESGYDKYTLSIGLFKEF